VHQLSTTQEEKYAGILNKETNFIGKKCRPGCRRNKEGKLKGNLLNTNRKQMKFGEHIS
jgi:hypothetical protein